MKYQLVIQLPCSSDQDYDKLIQLEDELINYMGENHIVDGHDIGTGEINIFIHTNQPKTAFEIIVAHLPENEMKNIKAAYRLISGEEYEVIWPQYFAGEFSVI